VRETVRMYDANLPDWINVDTVPVLMLFVVLMVVPQEKAECSADGPTRPGARPTLTEAVFASVALWCWWRCSSRW
jgi:hypothetical protein